MSDEATDTSSCGASREEGDTPGVVRALFFIREALKRQSLVGRLQFSSRAISSLVRPSLYPCVPHPLTAPRTNPPVSRRPPSVHIWYRARERAFAFFPHGCPLVVIDDRALDRPRERGMRVKGGTGGGASLHGPSLPTPYQRWEAVRVAVAVAVVVVVAS